MIHVNMRIQFEDGEEVSLGVCTCGECGNRWFVLAGTPETAPLFCCYCGIRFMSYTDGDDVRRDMGGREL